MLSVIFNLNARYVVRWKAFSSSVFLSTNIYSAESQGGNYAVLEFFSFGRTD